MGSTHQFGKCFDMDARFDQDLGRELRRFNAADEQEMEWPGFRDEAALGPGPGQSC